ncbi:MAG: PAS domain S-box protein [Pseudomonadales bacterium]|nr:PAS domain S-box protein [Pseudomonadales bacterium]
MTTGNARVDSKFYSALLQSSVDPIIIINEKGLIYEANQATLTTFGYSLEELLYQNVSILMTGADAVQHNDYISRYVASREPHIIGIGRNIVGKHKNGEFIHFRLAVSEVIIDDQRYFTGILSDISELVDKNRKLKLQSSLLSKISQWASESKQDKSAKLNSFLCLLSEAAEATCVTFNPSETYRQCLGFEPFYACHQLGTGLEHESLLGASTLAIGKTKSIINEQASLANLNAKGSLPVRCVASYPLFSQSNWIGSIRFFLPSPQPESFLFTTVDLLDVCLNHFIARVELSATMHQLTIANDRFARSQNGANMGTWDWDIQTGDLYWTERIAPLFGYSAGELETSYENFITAVHPDDREIVEAAIANCIESDATYDVDHRVVWPDGSIHWVNEKGDVQRDKNGKAIKMLGVIQDINRAKMAEEQSLHARIEAEKASRSKSEFLSLMSHELRTPLNSVMGFAQLLDQMILDDNQALYVGQILQGGGLLVQLVNDVLDFAKIDSFQNNLDISEIDLHQLTQQCINLLRNQADLSELSIDHVCDGQHAMVRGDYLRLKQVIINLLSNAIKYNKKGGSISIDCESKQGSLRMRVTDTGVGIPTDRYNEVFQPFSRLEFKNSSIEGVGIGLVVTKKLIETMGGAIGFKSEYGIGSCFWIDLPVGEHGLPAKEQASDKDTKSIAAPIKLLYIEDNPSNIRLVQSVVSRDENIEFLKAMTGEQGLKLTKTQKPDVVLLDINLPDMNGIDVCACIKQDPATKLIPTIALTADIARHKDTLGDNPNFYSVIYKPFELQELLDTVLGAASVN